MNLDRQNRSHRIRIGNFDLHRTWVPNILRNTSRMWRMGHHFGHQSDTLHDFRFYAGHRSLWDDSIWNHQFVILVSFAELASKLQIDFIYYWKCLQMYYIFNHSRLNVNKNKVSIINGAGLVFKQRQNVNIVRWTSFSNKNFCYNIYSWGNINGGHDFIKPTCFEYC